jgi:hypothetical protein
MSEIVDNAIIMQKLIHKLKDFIKDEKNINELKQFIWNKLPHKYKDNNETYNYINSNISNSLNGLSTRNNDNFLFTIKQLTNLELINDLLNFIDSDYYDEIEKLNNKVNEINQQLQKIKISINENNVNETNEILNDIRSVVKMNTKDIAEIKTIQTKQNEEIELIKEDIKFISNKVDKL